MIESTEAVAPPPESTESAEISTAVLLLGQTLKLAESRVLIPNALARSAVFSSMPNHAVRKVYTEPTTLTAWGDVQISQVTGSQLTQAEETVWLLLVRRALRSQPYAPTPGCHKLKIEFMTADFLRELGQPTDSQNRNALRKSIEYLGRARFILQLPEFRYEGNMLDVATGAMKGDSKFCVWLDIAISGVFLAGWSYVDLKHRQALKQNPLAQWLLSHYSTHANPMLIGHEKLKLLADRGAMRADKWLVSLGTALVDLQAVTGWECTLDEKRIVRVRKGPAKKVQSATDEAPEAAEVAPMTTFGGACATDEQLLESWLQSMPESRLRTELGYLDASPPKGGRMMQAPDLRSHLRAVITASPGLLEKRIAKQRAKEYV